jgi:hypothetical protein
MLISIVIPTRERAGVLRHALASCLRIADDDIEIVVSDNASQDDTAEVVAAVGDRRVRYVRTPQRCSMRENFEFAVGQARGDYVFIMGDDDAMLADQFAYMRALLEEHTPDSLTGAKLGYAWPGDWPGDSAPKITGRLKLVYRSVYGSPEFVEGAQLRAIVETKGAAIKWDAPRLYGGVMSRRVIEHLKAKTGQAFMGKWPDIYVTFAAPAVIERHIKVRHPFFIGAVSPKSQGLNHLAIASARASTGEHKRFLAELKLDPLSDPIAETPTIQIGELSLLDLANQYAYDGKLSIDYPREFARALDSLRDVEGRRQTAAIEALAQFAAARGLAAELRDPSALAARCPPPDLRPVRRPERKLSFVFVDRAVVWLDPKGPTDIATAAAAYDRLLGRSATPPRARPVAWFGLLGRAIAMLARRGSGTTAQRQPRAAV